MPKIKTKKYEIDGNEIEVAFNCSSKGMFSTSLGALMCERLNINSRLEGTSLNEIEKTVDDAFIEYKNSKTSYRLMIGIMFGASGKFIKKPDGSDNTLFYGAGNPMLISNTFFDLNSLLGIDFRVLMEEDRDGRLSYFETAKKGEVRFFDGNMDIDGYVKASLARVKNKEYLIEFSEPAIRNLNSIVSQIQRASLFLSELMCSENIHGALSSIDLKMING